MKMYPIINYLNNINLISATVDMKLTLAYSNAMSSKNKLSKVIDATAINKTTCVEKLLNATILLYTSLDLESIRYNIILMDNKST